MLTFKKMSARAWGASLAALACMTALLSFATPVNAGPVMYRAVVECGGKQNPMDGPQGNCRIVLLGDETQAAPPASGGSRTVIARGLWLVRGQPGKVAKTEELSDGTFIVTLSSGQKGRGRALSKLSFIVDLPQGRNTIGRLTPDAKRIDWPNGSYWTLSKMEFAGQTRPR